MSDTDKKPGATERLGGSALWDEAILPWVNQFVDKFVDAGLDIKGVDAMIRALSPLTISALANIMQPAANIAIGAIPLTVVGGNANLGHFLQDVLRHGITHTVKRVKEKGGIDKMTPEEFGATLQEGLKEGMARKLVIDPLGHLHTPDCPEYRRVFARNNDQRPQQPNQPPRPSRDVEVTIETAIARKLMCAPCCFPHVQSELAKPPAPKAEKKAVSPAEVLGRDPELAKQFGEWFKSLSSDERTRVRELLKHLDSVDELRCLMALDPSIRGELLTLLENTNGSFTAAQFLKVMSGAAKSGAIHVRDAARKAWKAYKTFDAGLAPVAARLEANLKSDDRKSTLSVLFADDKPRKKAPWYKALFRFI